MLCSSFLLITVTLQCLLQDAGTVLMMATFQIPFVDVVVGWHHHNANAISTHQCTVVLMRRDYYRKETSSRLLSECGQDNVKVTDDIFYKSDKVVLIQSYK